MERGNDLLTPADAASVLAWWADAGVDTLIDEEPHDWLRPQSETPAATPASLAARELPPQQAPTPAPTLGRSLPSSACSRRG
jgi:DNA polymerase